MPLQSNDLCSIVPSWRRWGRTAAVARLVEAARRFRTTGNGKLSLADISRRRGGYFWPHVTHRLGLDADLRPARRDGRQCRVGTTWRSRSYDRAGTRALIWAIRAAAHGRVDVILFNDPVLVRAGLTKPWPGHGNHLHVRYCSPEIRRGLYACHRHHRGHHHHHKKHHHKKHHHKKHHHKKHHHKKHHARKHHKKRHHKQHHQPTHHDHHAANAIHLFEPGVDVTRGFGFYFFR